MSANVSALGSEAKRKAIVARTLQWWDRCRRTLAWRAEPGETPAPYRVWLSEVLLQQTTAQAAAPRSHEVCTDKVVTTQKPVKDKDRVLGTVAGAVVGGVVGHEIGGHGTTQDVATAGGAIAGGYAGNRVQKGVQKSATEQTTERECHTVYD